MIALRTTIESLGPAYPTTCTRCRRPVTLHYSRRRVRRTALNVPVTRARTTHVLTCPQCFHDDELTEEQGEHAAALTRTLAAYRRGDLPEGHLRQHLTALWQQAGAAPLPAPAV